MIWWLNSAAVNKLYWPAWPPFAILRLESASPTLHRHELLHPKLVTWRKHNYNAQHLPTRTKETIWQHTHYWGADPPDPWAGISCSTCSHCRGQAPPHPPTAERGARPFEADQPIHKERSCQWPQHHICGRGHTQSHGTISHLQVHVQARVQPAATTATAPATFGSLACTLRAALWWPEHHEPPRRLKRAIFLKPHP